MLRKEAVRPLLNGNILKFRPPMNFRGFNFMGFHAFIEYRDSLHSECMDALFHFSDIHTGLVSLDYCPQGYVHADRWW